MRKTYIYFDTKKRHIITLAHEIQNTSGVYVQLNAEQMAFFNTHRHATYDEIWQAQEYVPPTPTPEQLLETARQDKIREIMDYDVSDNVNGFYLNGELKWLDKDTRTTLANTIESMKIVGMNTLTIWFGDTYIEVGLELAKQHGQYQGFLFAKQLQHLFRLVSWLHHHQNQQQL